MQLYANMLQRGKFNDSYLLYMLFCFLTGGMIS